MQRSLSRTLSVCVVLGLTLIAGTGCVRGGAALSEFCLIYEPFPWTVYDGQEYQEEVHNYIDDNEIAYQELC